MKPVKLKPPDPEPAAKKAPGNNPVLFWDPGRQAHFIDCLLQALGKKKKPNGQATRDFQPVPRTLQN